MIKKISSILNKIDSTNFLKVYKNLDCLSIAASSSYSTNDDIVNALYVIAFDKKPSTHYTFTKNIEKQASVNSSLNLLQKFLLFKKASGFMKESLNLDENIDFLNFPKYVEKQASVPSEKDSVEFIETEAFGKVAKVSDKYFIVNPASGKITSLALNDSGIALIKKADDESEDVYNEKSERDGLREIETPEDKFKEFKEEKTESFSASDLSENLAYIKQNSPDNYKTIKDFLQQNLVGEDKKAYEFLETLESTNFQFTEATELDGMYDGHSQYQDLLKNKVLPLLKDMPEYQDSIKDRVDPDKE